LFPRQKKKKARRVAIVERAAGTVNICLPQKQGKYNKFNKFPSDAFAKVLRGASTLAKASLLVKR